MPPEIPATAPNAAADIAADIAAPAADIAAAPSANAARIPVATAAAPFCKDPATWLAPLFAALLKGSNTPPNLLVIISRI